MISFEKHYTTPKKKSQPRSPQNHGEKGKKGTAKKCFLGVDKTKKV